MGKLRDIDIRKEFIKRNLKFFKSTTFVNEMGINSKNIVDLAALDFNNNIFYGFEIKSEVDSLKRLPKQLSTYSTFFNIVYVVAHEKHTKSILNFLDTNSFTQSMGYIEVNSDLNFKEIRKAKFVKPRFDSFIRNLDLEELSSLCESKGQFLGWESKGMLVDKVKRLVNIEEVYEHMYNKVKRYFYKRCPKCGSTLYYNKKNRYGHKESFCYECGSKIKDD
mgnify:CR=1 FL=1